LKNTCSASASVTECFSFFMEFAESHSKSIEAGKSAGKPDGRPYMSMIYLREWMKLHCGHPGTTWESDRYWNDGGQKAQEVSPAPRTICRTHAPDAPLNATALALLDLREPCDRVRITYRGFRTRILGAAKLMT
jgi:hypothetical protein